MRTPPKFRNRIRPSTGSGLLTTKEAARYLTLSQHTLEYWRKRTERRGPVFIKLHGHAIRYRMSDLERFLDARTVQPRQGF